MDFMDFTDFGMLRSQQKRTAFRLLQMVCRPAKKMPSGIITMLYASLSLSLSLLAYAAMHLR
jgi:hypothetical protein